MFTCKKLFSTLALLLTITTPAHATTVNLLADGQWNEFNVDDFSSASQGTEWIDMNFSNSPDFGSLLFYQFTIAQGFTGHLSIVDGGFAGDRFEIFNNGQHLGITSNTHNDSDFSNDFESNFSNNHFSSGLFTLNEGQYLISGSLFSTLQNFNATNGAIKLDVSPATQVPEPNAIALFLAGFSLLFFARRRAQ